MILVAYYRVSTNAQDYERQVTQIKDYCEKFNYTLKEEFAEKESGRKKVRPELTKLLIYLDENKNIDGLIISELSRLGRTDEVLNTIQYLSKRKITLISIKEKIETLDEDKKQNSATTLLTSILSSINSFELDTTKYRSKSGIRQSIINGKAGGTQNLPYGYKKDGNKNLVIDKEEADIVMEIFKMCINNIGTKRIANYLNDNNKPTRTAKIVEAGLNKKDYNVKLNWCDGSVYSILKNDIYIGQRKHRIKQIEGYKSKYEYEFFYQEQLRIISDDTFYAAQTALKKRGAKQPHSKFNYLLDRKKIICGICGLTYFAHKRKDSKDNVYKCISTRYTNTVQKSCGNNGVNIDKMEALVQFIILHNFKDILQANLNDNTIKDEIENYKKQIEELQKELRTYQIKEENLVDMRVDNLIDNKLFSKKIKPIKDTIRTIEEKILRIRDALQVSTLQHRNLINIKELNYNLIVHGTKLPSNIVNQITSTITITPIESCDYVSKAWFIHCRENEFFTKKHDKFSVLTFESGVSKLKYLISQREDYVYDLNINAIKFPYQLGFDGYEWKLDLQIK